jgi:hypothetical protein
MAQIIERLFTYVPSKVLAIGGEQWSRKISLGNQWSRVRLGFLGALGGSASYTGSYLLMGFSSGQVGGATAVGGSAIGASLSGNLNTAAGVWTYQSNSGYPYYQGNGSGKVYRRMPSMPGPFGPAVSAETSASISTVYLPASGGTNYSYRRAPVYFDISREVGGGGTATVSVYGMPSTAMTLDFRPDHFLDGLDLPGTPTLYGTTMTQVLNTTIPISDLLGGLDSVFIMWQRTLGRLELSAIGAVVSRPSAYPEGIGGAADIMSAYNFEGTALPEVLTAGSGFAAQGVFSGTYTNPALISGWAGTSGGFPYDSWEGYSTGTVVNDVTVNGGFGWLGNGIV